MDINGKAALVTGGAGGLGEATARRLVADGARVVIADLAEEKGKKLAADLDQAAVFVSTDVTSDDSVANAVAAVADLGELRVAVCAHGGPVARQRVLGRDGAPMPQTLFDRTVKIYLSGTFNVLRQSAAAMAALEPLESGVRGLVVNTASIRHSKDRSASPTTAPPRVESLASAWLPRVISRLSASGWSPSHLVRSSRWPSNWTSRRLRRNGARGALPQADGTCVGVRRPGLVLVGNDYINGETIRIDGAQRFGLK